MRWIESIRWGGEYDIIALNEPEMVYSESLANDLYKKKKSTAKQLSMWKQQNIRMALKEGYNHTLISSSLVKSCGYCFRYRNGWGDQYHSVSEHDCKTCPLYKKTGRPCYELVEFGRIIRLKYRIEISETYREHIDPIEYIKKNHKKWCIRIGLWKDDWT